MLKPVSVDSRKVGDGIKVYDIFNGHNKLQYEAKITRITKKYIFTHYIDREEKFHRATGYIVGFSFPVYMYAINPETSKESHAY